MNELEKGRRLLELLREATSLKEREATALDAMARRNLSIDHARDYVGEWMDAKRASESALRRLGKAIDEHRGAIIKRVFERGEEA